MTKRFTIKSQDDLFGVVDNYSADKVCVINGIRTEIEAEWLCKDMNTLNDENEQLKAQLLYDGDGVCNICKHQCLVESGKYFVARCEKEHEECSKVDLQYCEDFELVRDYE